MTVIPFSLRRFTKADVGAFVDLCYQLTGRGLAGGWARQTADDGGDTLTILNPADNNPKYSFGRDEDGVYLLIDGHGQTICVGPTINSLLKILTDRIAASS